MTGPDAKAFAGAASQEANKIAQLQKPPEKSGPINERARQQHRSVFQGVRTLLC